MSKEVLKQVCESFGITEEEYQKMKDNKKSVDHIQNIMEFSGIDDMYRSGIIISREDNIERKINR